MSQPGASRRGTPDDIRFSKPLYTIEEAARFLRVPTSTLATWARGYTRERESKRATKSGPVISTFPSSGRRQAAIPFVGLTEGLVVAAFRRAGVSMQHIRRAIPILETEIPIAHALASRRLYTDGAKILFNHARDNEEILSLVVVVTRQAVFAEVVQDYLSRVTYATDGWASRLRLPMTERPIVEVDPRRAFGQPVFVHGGSRIEDVMDRFRAGDSPSDVAEDFGVPVEDILDVIRAALPAAA